MSDLQCPVRVRLVAAPLDERTALRIEHRGSGVDAVLADLDEVVDSCRGELVQVVLDEGSARGVVRRLTEAEDVRLPALLEGDSSGWSLIADPDR